jgi:hypothetical protein
MKQTGCVIGHTVVEMGEIVFEVQIAVISLMKGLLAKDGGRWGRGGHGAFPIPVKSG